MDWVVLAQHAALTFVFDLDTPDEQGLVMDWSVPLVEGGSVRAAIRRAVDAARDHPGRPQGLARTLDSDQLLGEFLSPALALTLYLCAGNSDIVLAQPRNTASTAGRKQAGDGIPGEPRAWEVGWRVGAALRAARQAIAGTPRRPAATGRASPRPHIRRPHWQSFRVGPGRPNERTDSVVQTNAPTLSSIGSRWSLSTSTHPARTAGWSPPSDRSTTILGGQGRLANRSAERHERHDDDQPGQEAACPGVSLVTPELLADLTQRDVLERLVALAERLGLEPSDLVMSSRTWPTSRPPPGSMRGWGLWPASAGRRGRRL